MHRFELAQGFSGARCRSAFGVSPAACPSIHPANDSGEHALARQLVTDGRRESPVGGNDIRGALPESRCWEAGVTTADQGGTPTSQRASSSD
jgi:hypothetical protein